MPRLVRIALVFLLLAGCASSAHVTVARRAQRIEGQIWSPYCPGKLLIDCTTTQAGQLRDRITREVRAGRTDAQVLRDIRSDFGEGALARPPTGGGGVLIWLVPFAVFLLGGAGVVWLVRRRKAEAPAAVTQTVDPALQQLRDEVRRNI